MIKALLFFTLSGSFAYACPALEGRYGNCQSEIRELSGEYIIEEYLKDDVTYYFVQKTESEEDGEILNETIRTDNAKVSRKEKIPKYGVTVRIDTKSRCENNKVIGQSKVYSLGMGVGEFTTVMQRRDNTLYINIDGSVINREIHKRITCLKN